MSLRAKAIISGIAIEGMLVALSFASGWGPCGPGSPGVWVIIALHYPAVWVMNLFARLNPPDWVAMSFVVSFSAALWSLCIYAILRRRSFR